MACCLDSERTVDEAEQSDEILVLQSIYGDDIFTCDNSKVPFEGNFTINVQNNSVPFEVQCQEEITMVKYLFPINLYFSMPPNYPSSNPPDSNISCLWLTSKQLGILSRELYNQWKEGSNGVVLFKWIKFLEFDVLKFLNIKFPINLKEEELRQLTQFNIQRESEIFGRELHECPVCFCQKPGSQIFEVGYCRHMFCKECLTGFLQVHIADGNVNALICPAEKCDAQIFPNEIKYLVSEKDFDRYERILLKNTLKDMSDVYYCPKFMCRQPVIIENGDNVGLCHSCNFAFCTLCRSLYHGIQKCRGVAREMAKDDAPKALTNEKKTRSAPLSHEILLQIREEYTSSEGQAKKDLEQFYGRKAIRSALNYIRSEKFVDVLYKNCPRCKCTIEKFGGCNKMQCTKCWSNFCWLCLKLLGSNPYEHYRLDGGSPCSNKLFPITLWSTL